MILRKGVGARCNPTDRLQRATYFMLRNLLLELSYDQVTTRGWLMADYRLYCLDGDGHIGLADWIQADSDEEAIAKARALRPEAHRCEIWHKSRLAARLNEAGRFAPLAQ